jgi:hypothetical protein
MAKIVTTDITEIPDYEKIENIKRRLNVPPERKIAEVTPQGTVIRRSETATTRPDSIYVDLPEYKRGAQNVARMMTELAVMKVALPDEVTIRYDSPGFTTFIFEDYPLGYEYSPSSSHVLVKLPPDYPQT